VPLDQVSKILIPFEGKIIFSLELLKTIPISLLAEVFLPISIIVELLKSKSKV